jgi:hypothetical protein
LRVSIEMNPRVVKQSQNGHYMFHMCSASA